MKPIRLLASDLDGTLLHRGKASPQTLAALKAAHDAGCTVVVATGRCMDMLPRPIAKCPYVDAFITSNGARTMLHGVCLAACPFPPARVQQVLQILSDHGASLNVFFDGKGRYDVGFIARILKERGTPLRSRLHTLWQFLPRLRPARVIRRAAANAHIVEKIGGKFKTRAQADAARAALQAFGGLSVLPCFDADLDVTPASVSKGAALFALSNALQIAPDSIAACGDGGNDASMRMACGCFVAHNNAEPEALAAADVRTAPAAQDGVANWILEQFLAP